jgi:phosphatidylglycerol lysyltransferase
MKYTMKEFLARVIGPSIIILLFTVSIWTVHHALDGYRNHDIVMAFNTIPHWRIAVAMALTVLSFTVLAGYDLLAIRYVGQAVPWRKVGFVAVLSYAFSNTVGLSVLASGSVRYRLYSAWGLSPIDIAKVVFFSALTLWIGILTVGGSMLLGGSLVLPSRLHLPLDSTRPLGLLMLIVVACYVLLSTRHRRPLQFRSWVLDIPSPSVALMQVAIGALDWFLAGLILYVLLPSAELPLAHFLGVFLIAQMAGLISHVPAGLGVFDSLMLIMLSEDIPAPGVLGPLLAYRIIYYLAPLIFATFSLVGYEVLRHKKQITWFPQILVPWVLEFLPQVFALMTLVSGALLLFSTATPAVRTRLEWLRELLPLSVIETSHFIGSLVGTGLLLLARGLQRRLDAAYLLTVLLLATGVIASLLKGVDYEEASVLAALLICLLPCRQYFYRKASLLSPNLSASWIVPISVVLIAAVWLGLFSYKHTEYSDDLWWQFSFTEGGAPRFLRGMVGALVVVLFFSIARLLLRPTAAALLCPSPTELDQARDIINKFPQTYAHLALLGDKSLLFNESRSAFIMYSAVGRTWVAMGDPIGEQNEQRELAWKFRELCDSHGSWSVFYQVQPASLDIYLEIGLDLLKIGEEARVELPRFSLSGKPKKGLRHTLNHLGKSGYQFEIIPTGDVPSLLPCLKPISDSWLQSKQTREKRFSVGFYQEAYLQSAPVAVVRFGEEVVAFANLLVNKGKEQFSIDLMRYLPEAPNGIMDFLFVQLMLWGKEQGYRWFDLGMAPLSGLENRNLAPLWNRFGALVFGYGERFYNFRGLHLYKEKFDPRWEPRYLAAPGGLAMPLILTNLSVLIAGGVKGVITK